MQVLAHNFASQIDGSPSIIQRLADALTVRRGSVPGSRDYGSTVHEQIDRNLDSSFIARASSAVADAISHPPNGLRDITLSNMTFEFDNNKVKINVHVLFDGDNIAVPLTFTAAQ